MIPTFISRLLSRRVVVLVCGVLIIAGGLRVVFSAASSPSADSMGRASIRMLTGQAAAGDVTAEYTLAQAYQNGEGVKQDLPTAARWYAKAGRQGHLDAQYRLGLMYETGEGIRPDYQRAAKLYRQSGGLGNHPGAQFAMGRLYYHGLGAPPDFGTALIWFRKAAGQGHAGAQYLLGDIYRHGWGVDRNREESYKWYSLAMARGGQDGMISVTKTTVDPAAARAALAPSMNQAEIDRARRAVRDWRPSS